MINVVEKVKKKKCFALLWMIMISLIFFYENKLYSKKGKILAISTNRDWKNIYEGDLWIYYYFLLSFFRLLLLLI